MKLMPVVLLALALACPTWASPSFEGTPLQGEVLESVDAGAYTYLRLRTADGEIWAAILKSDVRKGAKIVIHDPMLMTQFESRSLNRTFDRIVFGSVVDTAAAPPAAAHMPAHGAAATSTAVPVGKVARATGPEARTVAEVHAQKGRLTGKPVAVRGTVVKVSSGIMNRNWLHLRDGSGSATDASNDLLVTSQQDAKVGDVLVARGVVRTDVDFGSGYAYPVVVEGATLKP